MTIQFKMQNYASVLSTQMHLFFKGYFCRKLNIAAVISIVFCLNMEV